eukprot:TRINITY_DN92141_c0_g1_i1.p1 TRINITY_DN92141_c0_g1~~TRINITY_DN92141_c0_g1_i1.p1  ORF type:complete len:448 (+),score=62.10 TRINITY_DN92141_c0_g1_i1:169-1512(+)
MAQNIADEGECNELDEELELLRAMWSDEELEIHRSPREKSETSAEVAAARLIARLAPNTGGNDQSRYLRCEVLISVPCGYLRDQEHPVWPQLSIGASSGLTDERRAELLAGLKGVLRGDLAGLPGALHAVLDAAQERLTAWNDEGPVGQCPVCLAQLEHGEDSSNTAAGLLRLPCYHVLHAACFAQIWEAEWVRQKDVEENAVTKISEAVVACPECRQVASWAAVPQIHLSLEHLVPASIEKVAVTSESDAASKAEEDARADEDRAATHTPSPHSPKKGGAAGSLRQKQESAPDKVDLFEVTMARGLRTRLKPKWDARDREGPILRNGACGVVAEFVDGKDATYLRPEGMDYWLPLNGGCNNCKMVRIDKDMPRPQKAPSGWIHGDNSLGVDVMVSSSLSSAKTSVAELTVAVSPTEGKASGKERKKKTKSSNAGSGYPSANKLLGA